jgi:monoamine oxidase
VTLDADVIVIGAGLSGLVCARRLVEGGARVIVLEARDRVGGRLHTGRVGNQLVDLGGHLMTASQDRLAALAEELGLESAIPDRTGKQRFPKGGLFAAFAQWRAVRRIKRMIAVGVARHRGTGEQSVGVARHRGTGEQSVGVARHRGTGDESVGVDRHRGAAAESQREQLDGLALVEQLQTIRNSVARGRLALHAELIFATDPADLSLFAYLERMAVTGGFAPQGALPGGGRERYFPEGAQELTLRLARDLEAASGPGDTRGIGDGDVRGRCEIRLSSNVVAIDQGDDSVRVLVNAGSECEEMPGGGFAERPRMKTYAAERVVLAIPPAVVRHIRVELPAPARAYVDGAKTGGVVKVFVAYERAFWRDAGWSGEAYRPSGANSPRAEELRAVRAVIANGNVLVAFVVGREAARWATRDPAERRGEVVDTLVAEFGEAAHDVIDYVEADWAADPWSAGCVASTLVGVLASGAAWGEAFGRVHVAGTEAARVWTGYMDGAIEAGERAAREVLSGEASVNKR